MLHVCLPWFQGAVARVSNEGMIAQWALNGAFIFSPPPAFEALPVKDLLFGYNNSVYTIGKVASALSQSGPVPKLGLLATVSPRAPVRTTPSGAHPLWPAGEYCKLTLQSS